MHSLAPGSIAARDGLHTDPWVGVKHSTTTSVGVLTVASTAFFAVPTLILVLGHVLEASDEIINGLLGVWFIIGFPAVVFLWGYLLAVMITRFYSGAGIIRRKDHCMRCGYALAGCPALDQGITCPECGAVWGV